jgi:hypothetical protein
MRIIAATNLPIKFKLPGAFDPTCTGKRGGTGLMIASSVVSCGEAPEPLHDTTPEISHVEECNAFKAAKQSEVEKEVTKLATGQYDDLLGSNLPPAPVVAVPHDEYVDLILRPLGTKINNCVFVGWAKDPRTGREIKVVGFADIMILARNIDNSLTVEFLTDLCAFDESGNVVLLNPLLCMDIFLRKGDVRPIFPLLYRKPVPRPKQSPPKVMIT